MGIFTGVIAVLIAKKLLGHGKDEEVLSEEDAAIRDYYDTYLNNMYIFEGRLLNKYSKHYLDEGGFFFKNPEYRPDFPYINETFAEEEDESATPYPPEGAIDLDRLFDKYRSRSYNSVYDRFLCGEHEFLSKLPYAVLENCSEYVKARIDSLIKDYEEIVRYERRHENDY